MAKQNVLSNLNVLVPRELRNRIQKRSRVTGLSMRTVVETALEMYLPPEEEEDFDEIVESDAFDRGLTD